jgi:hypothetical protein
VAGRPRAFHSPLATIFPYSGQAPSSTVSLHSSLSPIDKRSTCRVVMGHKPEPKSQSAGWGMESLPSMTRYDTRWSAAASESAARTPTAGTNPTLVHAHVMRMILIVFLVEEVVRRRIESPRASFYELVVLTKPFSTSESSQVTSTSHIQSPRSYRVLPMITASASLNSRERCQCGGESRGPKKKGQGPTLLLPLPLPASLRPLC